MNVQILGGPLDGRRYSIPPHIKRVKFNLGQKYGNTSITYELREIGRQIRLVPVGSAL